MNTNHRFLLPLTTAFVLSGLLASAAPLTFDFKDPKGVNNVIFALDAPLESINGTGNGISGTITFDPAKPAATSGRIELATNSLTLGNPMQKDHMHGATWLDVANHPTITFEAKSLANVKTEGDRTTADVTGLLTVKGTTKEVTVPVSFTHLPDKLSARSPNLKGDLLVVRTSFAIKRSDYGLNAGKLEDKVADEIQLTLSIAGAAPKA
jgi:polyisoprenoid-binding protein YceI